MQRGHLVDKLDFASTKSLHWGHNLYKRNKKAGLDEILQCVCTSHNHLFITKWHQYSTMYC